MVQLFAIRDSHSPRTQRELYINADSWQKTTNTHLWVHSCKRKRVCLRFNVVSPRRMFLSTDRNMILGNVRRDGRGKPLSLWLILLLLLLLFLLNKRRTSLCYMLPGHAISIYVSSCR